MSKIKLKHSSGNSMSIGAPATNPASDLELKLPATVGSAGQVLKNNGTAGTLEFGYGIEFDNWMVNTGFEAENTFITSNWERMDQVGFAKIGNGMTQSSGVFTFPSTGIWNIHFGVSLYKGGTAVRFAGGHIYVSTNGSGGTFHESSTTYTNIYNQSGNSAYGSTSTDYTLDVTNTTNCVCKFHVYASGNIGFVGHDTRNCTYATFTRIGDT